MVVVLDLDECLIHSQFLQGPGAKYAHQVQMAEGTSLEDSAVDTFNISLPDGELVRVHERPYLHEFLQAVSKKYETHIFTAAMEVYAAPVLKTLDPNGTIFTNRWYRESCTLDPDMGAYVKSLNFAWGGDQLRRTVLVDNNPLSFLANPENGILVSSFYNDANDTTLPAVLDLLDNLDSEKDVRPILDSRFGLKQALGELSKGRPFAGREQQISEQQEREEQQEIFAASSS
jgi:CTD small phosphatase-like protein 2